MPNPPKPALKSAVILFVQVFAVILALLVFLFVYLLIKVGLAEALASTMKDFRGWLRALILIPTFSVAADLLGKAISRLWRSNK